MSKIIDKTEWKILHELIKWSNNYSASSQTIITAGGTQIIGAPIYISINPISTKQPKEQLHNNYTMYTTHVLLSDHMMTKETRSAMLFLVENMVKLGNNKTYGNEEKN